MRPLRQRPPTRPPNSEKAQEYVDRTEAIAGGLPGSPSSDTLHPSKSYSRLATSAHSSSAEAALLKRKLELLNQKLLSVQTNVEDVPGLQAAEVQNLKAEADAWKEKYKAAVASAKQKEVELEELRREVESAHTEVDNLQSQVGNEKQRNWELQYDLRDAQEEIQFLQVRLMNSIPARLQGEARDDDDGDDEKTARTSFLMDLPWQKYENARIRNLKDKLKAFGDRHKGKSRN